MSLKMGKALLLLVFWALGSCLSAEADYLKTEARSGDGAIKLLQRFNLHQHPCNYDLFYQLNGLSPDQPLLRGRKYRLPIQVREYNGTNIRSTIGIEDWDQAVAIQKYNERQLQRGLKERDYREGGKLWVPHHLHRCYNEGPKAVHASARTINFPLFGPDYAEVAVKSNLLEGKAFYLKSGHGGPDPGAMGTYNGHTICEDEYCYDVTLRLARRLKEHGATVYLIVKDPYDGIRDQKILLCDNDERHYGNRRIPINQLARLRDRAQIVNELYRKERNRGATDHLKVSIHIDSRPEHQRQDVFFYHYNHSRTGREVAQNLQSVFREKYRLNRPSRPYRGTVSGRNLYILRTTHPPAVLIELANIRNNNDLMRVILPSNRQALADWIFEGLAGFSP
jgi:N-acetylmuramoyl-L-alanine amidase